MAFTIGRAVFIRAFGMAGSAACTGLEQWRGSAFRTDRAAAGTAQFMTAWRKAVADRDPLVEYEALSAPKAFGLRHSFEIFEDAAL